MALENSSWGEETRHRALANSTRRRILRILEDLAKPTGVEALASTVGLHPNTVRSHLEVLLEADLVSRTIETRSGPGRPRLLYVPRSEESATGLGGYRLLAEMLTTTLQIAADDVSRSAEEAGRMWGHYLIEDVSPNFKPSHQEAVAQISAMLSDFGFDPHNVEEGARTIIDLCDCPFRELARVQPDVVCSLHLGLLRGSAEALGGSTSIESLEPFVEPSLCRTVLRSA